MGTRDGALLSLPWFRLDKMPDVLGVSTAKVSRPLSFGGLYGAACDQQYPEEE